MLRSLFTLAFLLTITGALAQQQVTLQSGAEIVGSLRFDATDVEILIDDAVLRVPLDQIKRIEPADATPAPEATEARTVLLEWLEDRARAASTRPTRPSLDRLSRAYRLEPSDPKIAYWYAKALVEAGSGARAAAVLAAHGETIEAADALRFEELQRAVEARVRLESCPPSYVARIDELDQQLAVQSTIGSDKATRAVAFRLIDQDKRPLPTDAFRINAYGNSESLETFAEGYCVFSFVANQGHSRRPQLTVNDAGYVPLKRDLSDSATKVAQLGEIVVSRRREADRRDVVVRVLDQSGEPIAGARVGPYLLLAGRSSRPPTMPVTDAKGESRGKLFPGNYNLTVSRDGYLNQTKRSVIDRGESAATIEIQLRKALAGDVLIECRTIDIATKSTGPVQQVKRRLGDPALNAGNPMMMGIRVMQRGDDLVAVTSQQMSYHHPALAALSWRRVLEPPFGKYKLSEISQLREEGEAAPIDNTLPGQMGVPHIRGTLAPVFQVTPGKVYLGENAISGHHPSGAGTLLQYKLTVRLDRDDP